MADSYLVVLVEVNGRSSASIPELTGVNKDARASGLISLLSKVDSGIVKGRITHYLMDDTGTAPGAEITVDQTETDGHYVKFDLGGQTWTLTEGVDWTDGASDTTAALALSNAINETEGLKDLCTAVPTVGVIALTYHFPSAVGTDLEISTDEVAAHVIEQFGETIAANTLASAEYIKVLDKT